MSGRFCAGLVELRLDRRTAPRQHPGRIKRPSEGGPYKDLQG